MNKKYKSPTRKIGSKAGFTNKYSLYTIQRVSALGRKTPLPDYLHAILPNEPEYGNP